jgi:hypothetical protein
MENDERKPLRSMMKVKRRLGKETRVEEQVAKGLVVPAKECYTCPRQDNI